MKFSQLLSRRAALILDKDTRVYLQQIIDGGLRMSDLLTGILNYAMVTHGPQNPNPTLLNDACRAASDNLTAAIQDSEAQVHCDISPRVKVRVENGQLVQLLQNLIGNAIKYRRPDVPPVVRVTVVSQDDNWLFTVKDNGLGIEKKDWASIFKPFRRLHGAEIAGTGIGLATCQRVVEHAGGRIWVDSVPGEGSTFSVLLPNY